MGENKIGKMAERKNSFYRAVCNTAVFRNISWQKLKVI